MNSGYTLNQGRGIVILFHIKHATLGMTTNKCMPSQQEWQKKKAKYSHADCSMRCNCI